MNNFHYIYIVYGLVFRLLCEKIGFVLDESDFFVPFFAIFFKFCLLFFADFYFFTSKSYSFDFKTSDILLNTNKC